MRVISVLLSLGIVLLLMPCICISYAISEFGKKSLDEVGVLILFDFNEDAQVSDWIEVSDTKRSVGKSKANIDIVESDAVRRAVFFTLLNPQEDGACFAGVRKVFEAAQDWSQYVYIAINRARSQGENSQYKITVQDDKSITNSSIVFEGFFDTTSFVQNKDGFVFISYPLDDLICSYHGQHCDDDISDVNKNHILSVGLQISGGVYTDKYDQRGVASLELDRIELSTGQ